VYCFREREREREKVYVFVLDGILIKISSSLLGNETFTYLILIVLGMLMTQTIPVATRIICWLIMVNSVE
jgi:hypothetical protein